MHRRHSARSARRVYGRRRRRFPRRSVLLPGADVRLPCHTRLAGGRDFRVFALRSEKASGAVFGDRSRPRRGDHGRRVFARQSVYLQYARVRSSQAAVSDSAGGRRCRFRDGAVLEMRNTQAVYQRRRKGMTAR